MRVLVCFSMSEDDAARLAVGGPRRDIPLLASRLGATLLFRRGAGKRRMRSLNRLVGPHVRHAWDASTRAKDHDVIFADGEHVGLPLLFFLWVRRRRRPVVMLGHFIEPRWKRALLRVGSRLTQDGVLILHSVVQADAARGALHQTWTAEVLPYQVDTEFWASDTEPVQAGPAVVVAVGSEHRDYQTLVEAARDLPVEVRIAAGSHWAREQATAAAPPPNVQYEGRTLPFSELRQFYQSADMVVVPLHAVGNQSGVTTILEAMSMGRPVIVSATPGQREIVTGPVIREDGRDREAAADRGPQLFGLPADPRPTGWYVAPHDPAGLRTAICGLAGNPALRSELGLAGRRAVHRNFRLEQFVERFARVVDAAGAGR